MTDQPKITALMVQPAQMGLPSGPQTDPATVTDCLLHAAAVCNVLAPMMQITHLPADHQITFMVVLFPIDGIKTYTKDGEVRASRQQSNGVWYATDNGNLAHHRSALDQLSQAAGITWVPEKCGRTDDRSHPYRWAYRMTVKRKGLDGRVTEVTREHELDLRGSVGRLSPAAEKAGKGLRNARIHGAQLCESKAANRCIRAALALRSYTVEEAARPFVLPVLQWVPDMSDPVIRRMVGAHEMGTIDLLYEAEAAAGVLVDDDRVIDAPPVTPPLLPDHEAARDMAAGANQPAREAVPVAAAAPATQGTNAMPWDQQGGRPPCTNCGIPLSQTQAAKTADMDGGPYCGDHVPGGAA